MFFQSLESQYVILSLTEPSEFEGLTQRVGWHVDVKMHTDMCAKSVIGTLQIKIILC